MTSPQGFSMVPRWLVERSDISDRDVRLFALLSGRVRESGIRMTHAEIADLLGCSTSTAKRTLRSLRDLGVVDWTERDGDLDGVLYTLTIDRRGLDEVDQPRPTPPTTSDLGDRSGVTHLPYRGLKTPSLREGSAPAAARGTRIDASPFDVTPAMRAWAADKHPAVDLDSETEKFVDYWTSESGARARKVDWTGTWRNWIRRAAEGRTSRPAVEQISSAWSKAQPISDEPACHLCPEQRIHRHTRDGSMVLR